LKQGYRQDKINVVVLRSNLYITTFCVICYIIWFGSEVGELETSKSVA